MLSRYLLKYLWPSLWRWVALHHAVHNEVSAFASKQLPLKAKKRRLNLHVKQTLVMSYIKCDSKIAIEIAQFACRCAAQLDHLHFIPVSVDFLVADTINEI